MVKYAVTYDTKYGGRAVLNVFKNKSDALKQLRALRKSPSFRNLGYSNPRIRKEKRKNLVKEFEKDLERKRLKALKRNVGRRKGKYATARDIELMVGY